MASPPGRRKAAWQWLNRKFRRLAARRLHRNKAVVAVARELCGYLWELHRQVASEIAAKAAA